MTMERRAVRLLYLGGQLGVCLLVGLVLMGCGAKGGGGSSSGGGSTAGTCDAYGGSGSANPGFTATAGLFTVSPISTGAISYVTPLGHTNAPAGDVYPSDHMYFYLSNYSAGANAVYAPAAGTVVGAGLSTSGEATLMISVDTSFVYYFHHVTLASGIAVGSHVCGGHEVGSNSGLAQAVDLGVVNYNQNSVPNILDTCLQTMERHTDLPLNYYTGSLQTTLLGLVQTNGSNKNGKVGYDVSGALTGDWILAGAPTTAASDYNYAADKLAFVYDTTNTSTMVVSVGGTLTAATTYTVLSGTDFGSVTQASGAVAYTVIPQSGSGVGTLLVQLTGSSTLKAEYFSGGLSSPAFDANAQNYVR